MALNCIQSAHAAAGPFSSTPVTIFSFSSFFLVSDLAYSSSVLLNSSFIMAISFSVSTLFKRSFILKYSFVHGQCLTFENVWMLHWMQKTDSPKAKQSTSTVKENTLKSQTLQQTHIFGIIFFLIQVSWGMACVKTVHVISCPRQSSHISWKDVSWKGHLADLPWRTPAIKEQRTVIAGHIF